MFIFYDGKLANSSTIHLIQYCETKRVIWRKHFVASPETHMKISKAQNLPNSIVIGRRVS